MASQSTARREAHEHQLPPSPTPPFSQSDEISLESVISPQPGDFPSPPALPKFSSYASSSFTRPLSRLPHPRPHSLRPGSNKEDLVRRYVEDRLLDTSRRHVKRFSTAGPADPIMGFNSFPELCLQLDGVVNILWLSGTPGLQTPFLLKVASDFTQYVRSFPPAPRATFALLGKLDHCFASLLSGEDIESHQTLPGFENGLHAGMTVTDMVRCRSLVEQTRVLIVDLITRDASDGNDDDDEIQHDVATAGGAASPPATSLPALLKNETHKSLQVDEEKLHMDAARVYENTIVQLGARMGDLLSTTAQSTEC